MDIWLYSWCSFAPHRAQQMGLGTLDQGFRAWDGLLSLRDRKGHTPARWVRTCLLRDERLCIKTWGGLGSRGERSDSSFRRKFSRSSARPHGYAWARKLGTPKRGQGLLCMLVIREMLDPQLISKPHLRFEQSLAIL